MSQDKEIDPEDVLKTKDLLPIINSTREEMHFSQQLVDSLVDKFFDTGKLLLGFSVPALITVYFLKTSELRATSFLVFTIILAALGILLMVIAFVIKLKLFTPYLSTSRINLLTAHMEADTEALNLRLKKLHDDRANPRKR